MASRALLRPARAMLAARSSTRAVRGGSAGGSQHPPKELSAQMKAYQATTPRLFYGTSSKKGTYEYWEGSYWAFMASIGLIAVVYPNLPNTDVTDWARDEAEARARRRLAGLEVEYGMNYAALEAAGDGPVASRFQQRTPNGPYVWEDPEEDEDAGDDDDDE